MTVSRHFLRRTARRKRDRLMKNDPNHGYVVERCARGPFRWRVERTPL